MVNLTVEDRARLFPMHGERDQNPPGMGFWALVREDHHTHETWLMHGFWALFVHRLGNWRMSLRPRILRFPFTLLHNWLYRVVIWVCRLEMPYPVKIGRRVRFWHHGGSVIGACEIGDDVQIRHNVTIGLANHTDPRYMLPIIEDRVIIGAGACILGPITIGHDSVVAANAVVTRDVPPYTVVGGIPAKVIKRLDERPQETEIRRKVY